MMKNGHALASEGPTTNLRKLGSIAALLEQWKNLPILLPEGREPTVLDVRTFEVRQPQRTLCGDIFDRYPLSITSLFFR
jgi:hypothetical protein